MQIKKSDYTDAETFFRCRVQGQVRMLDLLRDIFMAEELSAFVIPSVKVASDRSDRYAVTIIFQARTDEVPLHRDDRAQAQLAYLVDRQAAPALLPR